MRVGGACLKRVRIGESCEDSAQCQGGSSCVENACVCPEGLEDVDGVCTKKVQKPKKSLEVSGEQASAQPSFCPVAEQVPYMEPRTKKLRYCVPSKKGSCPHAYVCAFSSLLKKNICCGRNAAGGLIGLPGGGSDGGGGENIVTRINQVASIVSPPTASGGGGSGPSIRALPSTNEVCDSGEPHMLGGIPQTCTSTVCPSKYRCVFCECPHAPLCAVHFSCAFSEARQELLLLLERERWCVARPRRVAVCRTCRPTYARARALAVIPGAHGCPSGNALLFPSTGTPVQCSPEGANACPHGHQCVGNVNTGNYQCCTTETQTYARKLKKRGERVHRHAQQAASRPYVSS